MIAIINTGEVTRDGQHCYRLQINEQLIGEFTHRRSDGLAACLRRAAEAAERAHEQYVEQLVAWVESGQCYPKDRA